MVGTMNLESGKGGESSIVLGDSIDVFGVVNASGDVTHYFSTSSRFLTADSRLSIESGSAVHFNALVQFVGGSHGGNGSIAVNDSGSLSGGSINIDRFEVSGSASFDLNDGTLSTNVLDPTSSNFRFTGGRLAADLALGSLLNEGGTVAPGPSTLSAGQTTIVGNYTQSAAGRLEIQLGGTALDYLDVAGLVNLDGLLDVSLLRAYSPMLGDEFDIILSGGLSGAFESLVLPSLASGLEWDVLYDSFNATLEVIAPFTADFDNDGDVDSADLGQWEGDSGLNSNSDADLDGDSDGSDFLAWQRQFGGGLTSIASLQAVPEPSTLALVGGLAIAGLLAQRFNKRQHRKTVTPMTP